MANKKRPVNNVRRMHWTFDRTYDRTYDVSWNPFYQNPAKNMSVYQNDIEMENIERILECMQSFPMINRLLEDIKNKD
jgi:hypothetical protein